jgi:hypothetical protein
MPKLHVIVGAWASGKTILVEQISSFGLGLVIFDWDLLIPGLSLGARTDVHSDPATWDGLRQMWCDVIGAVLASGLDVVLVGPLQPDELAIKQSAGIEVRGAYLDCPDELLTSRLRERGATENEIAEEVETARRLRRSDLDPIDVGERTPAEVTEAVATWLRSA